METEVKFENINYREAVRYLAMNWSKKICRMSDVRKLLPWMENQQAGQQAWYDRVWTNGPG